MGLFRKLKVGPGRTFNSHSVDCIPEAITVSLTDENSEAEIDGLVLHEDKLFAIEIKRWRGSVIEREDGFHKYKQDRYTDDIREKPLTLFVSV